MKLQELMNDDTCQILFAIIIGIIVCYFIFGQNGCGNGFSVGGQTCEGDLTRSGNLCSNYTVAGEVRCNQERPQCNWNQGGAGVGASTVIPPPVPIAIPGQPLSGSGTCSGTWSMCAQMPDQASCSSHTQQGCAWIPAETDPAPTTVGTRAQLRLINNIKKDIEYQVNRITGGPCSNCNNIVDAINQIEISETTRHDDTGIGLGNIQFIILSCG